MKKINQILPDSFYQPLFDAVGEGMIVVNDRGVIILANKRVELMFGYTIEELMGETIGLLVPKELRPKHSKHVDSYFVKPSVRNMSESRNLFGERKDNSRFPIEISLNHFQKDGKTYAIGLITDITERREAERKISTLNEELERKVEERTDELMTSQKLYNAIARNFPDGTINVFDEKLNYVFVEGRELFKIGITSEKLIGSNYIDRLPVEISDKVKDQLMKVFKGVSCSFEIALNNNHYVLDAVPLPNSAGEIKQILVIEKNIAYQKKAENEMRKNLLKERELNHLKSRFVSMASHEFRTPLGTILSSATLTSKYQKEEDQPKREKHVKRIKSSVENLIRILDDFLSFDRLESGKIGCVPSEFDIEKEFNETIESVKGLLKDGQEVQFVHKGAESIVTLDRQLTNNILLNLLSNAIKYSEENYKISVVTEISGDNFFITIQDEGMGIPEKEQVHLFERFFRANNAVNIQGTGLGLNIVKKYVDLMQGEIEFASKEGVGTKFIIKFPKKIKL